MVVRQLLSLLLLLLRTGGHQRAVQQHPERDPASAAGSAAVHDQRQALLRGGRCEHSCRHHATPAPEDAVNDQQFSGVVY